MKSLIPIILILASLGLFMFFTNNEYQNVKSLQIEIASYDKALGKSREVLKKRGELQAKYAQFANSDLDALKKLLPDHVDNVQLILDINGIARKHNMAVSKIKISEDASGSQNAPIGPDIKTYSSILVSFRTKSSYPDFIAFIKDLEQGLRLVDITNLSFKEEPSDNNEYSVTIRTYWLK
ncbi:MAG TPA: type 4a pilus biogenesis protein PilO [Candidatus Paceibacterota bacterium]